jgi:anaerobic magnesium-protoporphyrin IX monomethyl ester cyclase
MALRRGAALFESSRTDPRNFEKPDLVLVQMPGWGVKTPPLSLATLAAYVRAKGYKVLPLDLNVEFYHQRREGFRNVWNDNESDWFWRTESRVRDFISAHADLIDAHIEELLATGAKLFGFSCYSSCINLSLHFAKELKRRRPDIITVFGGPHVSRTLAGKDIASRPFVDVVAQGEGELILLEVVERVARGESLDGIPGTLRRGADHGDRELIRKLDDLPFADLDDYDFHRYQYPERLPAMASRGCPNRCNYCSEKVYWSTYRGFSPKRIADEIHHQLARHPQIVDVEFMDSLINGVMSRMLDMARQFIPKRFNWFSQAVIRKEMTYEVFKLLADSGCKCLAFGLETSSAALMLRSGKDLAKGVDVDQLVRDAHRAGLTCTYNFMFGLPGETAEDAAASLEFLQRHREDIHTVNPSAAFCGFSPGTPAHERPDDFGILKGPPGGDQYWVTKDGSNDLLVRLERFEAFCSEAVRLGVDTTYPHPKLLDRDRLIAEYMRHHKRWREAIPYYDRWLQANPGDSHALAGRRECVAEASLPAFMTRLLRRAMGAGRGVARRLRLN